MRISPYFLCFAVLWISAPLAWGQKSSAPHKSARESHERPSQPVMPSFDDANDRPHRAPPTFLPGWKPDEGVRVPSPPGEPKRPKLAPGPMPLHGASPQQVGPLPPLPFLAPAETLEKYDPELYQLLKDDQEFERKTADLAMRWRRAPKNEREALQQELTDAVSQHFELRQRRRRLQLERLEQELQSLRKAIEKREQAREAVIHRRVAELLGIEEELGF